MKRSERKDSFDQTALANGASKTWQTLAHQQMKTKQRTTWRSSNSAGLEEKKSEASNKQRRWRENGGFVVEKRQELYQHSKCNVKQHCHATTQEDSVRELSISIECSISSSKLGQPKCSTESQEKGGLGTGPKPIHHIKSNILKNKTSSKSLHQMRKHRNGSMN